ncbi:1-acyl-sn-glycerol-3-phosphate acyltransferase [Azovibrio restrictus]|uniref:lysophospholipid acyltransferase family protein n=1 Tax=Azovibrio restrictus TaxID=146938 RepID=UPI0026EA054A|nr:lysophospholipid acyltransferase family protein [Azovibrio restrictus]MDD3481844.1 lysophospholipid acyltransferase family protein [Azovibrio restrictus]
MILLRSFLFWFLVTLLTIPFGVALVLLTLLPLRARFFVVGLWRQGFMGLARWVLGVKMVVKGRENIPPQPVLVLAKHQSAWETVALQEIFVPTVFVLKQELLRIPFFGWGLAALRMIAIDRSAGKEALRQMLEQGKDRLTKGIWVVVFPEGTRVPPGQQVRYKPGAAYLATKTGTPVLPVAHNAGEVWPKKALLIRPGTITVSIGPAIETQGLKDAQVNGAVEAWIEGEMRVLSPHRYPLAAGGADAGPA